jgi:xylulokinase
MYAIGIDIGTSGTKTVLFDAQGNAVASAAAEYPLRQPRNGWAEQDPLDWKNAVFQTLRAVTAGVEKEKIVGIGLSGQMHGLVMLDGNGAVLRPAILWCDGRTAAECAEITEAVGAARLIELTANPALPGFTASKILWVRKHEPEIYAKCAHILLPKDYIRYCLTGEFATEVSDASGMQLLDVGKRRWSKEVLDKLAIDERLLARVYESPEITGAVHAVAARETGLAAGIPVAGGAGDNAAAAVGVGCVEDGKAFTTLGTSGVVYAHMSEMRFDPAGRAHTFCCAVPGKWHIMGVTQGAGLSIRWFRDTFCPGETDYKNLDALAAASPVGANKLLYLPYLMGERTPHLDPNARGVFFGISAIHQKGDFFRAVMEGVSYSQKDCAGVLAAAGAATDDMTLCGGGAASPLWRQMLADVYGTPVKTTVSEEGPALGAAILALVGAKVYPSVEDACKQIVKIKNTENPNAENAEKYKKVYAQYAALYPALKGNFGRLADM